MRRVESPASIRADRKYVTVLDSVWSVYHTFFLQPISTISKGILNGFLCVHLVEVQAMLWSGDVTLYLTCFKQQCLMLQQTSVIFSVS
jgi:hypothetical protein